MTNHNAPTEAELAAELANAPEAPPADAPRGDGSRAECEIFEGCPITPLGVNGKLSYFLDGLGQMRALDSLNAENIKKLFGHHIPKLCNAFPQWVKDESTGAMKKKPMHFNQNNAGMAMHIAVSQCGVFNPDNAVRGVGAWTDDDGGLIYHMGDEVLYRGEVQQPGRIGKRIYPAHSPIPHPARGDNLADPVPPLMDVLESWNWTEPELHPFVALGMIATQMLCGALDWRPVFWLLAPAGAGKSELQRLMKMLHGDDGLVQSTDATKSGITSQLGQSSLPVAVDELEPGDERSSKEKDIIALARVAASGGQWFRGSADQTGVGGKVYSAFLFSSILIPGVMKTQDVQRLIKLELRPLKKGAAKLGLQPRTWRARGANLKAALIDRWPSWSDRLSAWRHALELADVTGRDADNWATVMAMADMAQSEDIASDDVMANWARKVAYQVNADRDDTTNDAQAMLLHLMGQPYDIYRRGEQFTLAQWVMAAAGTPGSGAELFATSDDKIGQLDAKKIANQKLARAGLRVIEDEGEPMLFIANARIPALNDLFRGSDWANGVWKQSAGRVPGARTTPHPLTLAGIRSRGTLMPIKAIPGLMSFPMDNVVGSGGDADGGANALEDFE